MTLFFSGAFLAYLSVAAGYFLWKNKEELGAKLRAYLDSRKG